MSGDSYYYLTKLIVNTFIEEEYSMLNETDINRTTITNFRELSTTDELWQVDHIKNICKK